MTYLDWMLSERSTSQITRICASPLNVMKIQRSQKKTDIEYRHDERTVILETLFLWKDSKERILITSRKAWGRRSRRVRSRLEDALDDITTREETGWTRTFCAQEKVQDWVRCYSLALKIRQIDVEMTNASHNEVCRGATWWTRTSF